MFNATSFSIAISRSLTDSLSDPKFFWRVVSYVPTSTIFVSSIKFIDGFVYGNKKEKQTKLN